MGVYISGVLAAIGCAFLGFYSVLSVIQLSMISSRYRVVMAYKPLVIFKLFLAIISGKLHIFGQALNFRDQKIIFFALKLSWQPLQRYCSDGRSIMLMLLTGTTCSREELRFIYK